ncbi:MAG: regulatory iron-sulfur-containing complex subunit RicT [Spirochaetia bacterium]|jgi:cell fate regulator YaaT (PSP1 superfamily)|nr:regulatory iron-sulfur-containing complex subunit RicT [Spirochaetia bacterium]
MSDMLTGQPEGVDLTDDIQDGTAELPLAAPKTQPKESEDTPEPIYRLKTLHSSETSFGYYVHLGSDWPHFRSRAELELLLEGPVGQGAAPENSPDSTEQRIPLRSLVVAPTKYGKDIVEVQGIVLDKASINPDELVLIERPAGIDDLRRLNENREKEQQAYVLCRDKIWARNLPMKLVSAHYLLDEPKILFYFTAESRVDFRELVKDLVSVFKMRIELRQIGVRDEARVTGGCGVCGRVLCCHGISDRLNPVSIKMAKDQNLSLNSLKISGPCGRLLCCLSYEHQFYKDARRELPQEGVKFTYDGSLFKVVEVNALTGTVKMAGEDGRVLDMKAERFKYEEGRWKVIEDQA